MLFCYCIITANKTNGNMWKTPKRVVKELFFPKRCFFCKKYGGILCADCYQLLDISSRHHPDRSKKYLGDIYSPCSYENKYAQRLIHRFKYKPFIKDLAIPLAQAVDSHLSLAGADINFTEFLIVPVPLAEKRERQRGFNQAAIIGKRLGHLWQIPFLAGALKKTRMTENQADLCRRERLVNLKGAFACNNPVSVKNKKIFLIDDVVTTGATMEECAKILKQNGVGEIIGICAARAEE